MSTVFASISTPGPPGPPGRTTLWLTGNGAPVSAQGLDGDMYLDIVPANVYGPKANGAWTGIVANIKGSTGATGATGPAGYSPRYIVGSAPPTVGTGNDGDMFLNSTTQDLYGPKAAGAWGPVIANIKGAKGDKGDPGVAYTPKGAWAAGTTYTQGDLVSDNAIAYIALQSANTGHVPFSSPTWWQPVAQGGSQTPWQSDIDGNSKQLLNVGKVGVGTATPSLPLSVVGTSTGAFNGAIIANVGATVGESAVLGFAIGTQGPGFHSSVGCVYEAANNAGLAFSTFSSTIAERMRITAAGNVGIGTTAPLALLHLSGLISSPSLSAITEIASVYGNTGVRLAIGVTNAAHGAWLQSTINDGRAFGLYLNPLGGNVGIGTTNPYANLTVFGPYNNPSLTFGSAATAVWAVSGGTELALFNSGLTGYPICLQTRQQNTSGVTFPLALNPLGGNVGIGTTAPGELCELSRAVAAGTHNWTLKLRNNVTGVTDVRVGIQFQVNSVAPQRYGAGILASNDGITGGAHLVFGPLVNDVFTEKLRIMATGNVGIGTTTPGCALDISGTLRNISATTPVTGVGVEIFYDTAASLGYCIAYDRSAGATKSIQLGGNGNTGIRVDPSGNVGINTAPGSLLHIIAPTNPVTVTTATQFTIGEASNNPAYRFTAGYYIDGSAYKGAIQATNANAAAGTLLLQPSGGKIGVGCTSPTAFVQVSTPLGLTNQLVHFSSGRSFTAQNDGMIIGFTSSTGVLGTHDFGAIFAGSDPTTGNGGMAWVEFRTGGNSAAQLSMNSPAAFLQAHGNGTNADVVTFRTGGLTRVILDGAGNLAISASNPAYKLDVAGDCNITGTYRVNGVPAGGGVTNQRVVTGSRANGGVYLNDTGKAMFVMLCVNEASGQTPTAYTDAANPPQTAVCSAWSAAANGGFVLSFWVLPGNFYRIVYGTGGSTSWVEWY